MCTLEKYIKQYCKNEMVKKKTVAIKWLLFEGLISKYEIKISLKKKVNAPIKQTAFMWKFRSKIPFMESFKEMP